MSVLENVLTTVDGISTITASPPMPPSASSLVGLTGRERITRRGQTRIPDFILEFMSRREGQASSERYVSLDSDPKLSFLPEGHKLIWRRLSSSESDSMIRPVYSGSLRRETLMAVASYITNFKHTNIDSHYHTRNSID